MSTENETPNEVPQGEVDVRETAKRIADKAKAKVVDSIKNAMNHLSPVKTRTIARMKQLTESSKTKHEKTVLMGNIEWVDTPPMELIGNLNMTINGGIGKITYVKFLKDPVTGYAIKEATPDGTEIGGNIKSHYVEETIEPAQAIRREAIAISGCPTVEVAKENMDNARKLERSRVNKSRGLD